MSVALTATLFLAILAGLVMIPLGLPGLWVVVAALLAGAALLEAIGWTLPLVGLGAAAVAEGVELLTVRAMGKRYGGSPRAFWGAILGGMAGLFVGLPVPLIGPLVTGFLGTFAGAWLVTFLETKDLRASGRVGWGVVLARTIAVGLKVGVGVALLGALALALVL